MQITKITSENEWKEVLSSASYFDLYHTYEFHCAHRTIDNGKPVLFYLKDGNDFIIFPLLERKISNSQFKDATSVYGYPGPLTNIESVQRFESLWNFLSLYLLDTEKYISVFSRINSITTNQHLLEKCFIAMGQTVTIDLTLPNDIQIMKYRSNHRRDIRKLVKSGFECSVISLEEGIDDFVNIYNSTMKALGASEYYFFADSYYKNLFNNTMSELRLIQCRQNDAIACMGIFSFTNDIVQYHLGGTAAEFYQYAPTKLMFDFVRKMSVDLNMKYLHLGGGLGSGKDNLYNFKRGFSDDIRTFYVCKHILDQTKYDELSSSKSPSNYFPLYRS